MEVGMKTIKYMNYIITKFDSGTIEVTKDGHIISPTRPILAKIAEELNISTYNANS